jgi:DNA-binding IclR family transcriptional regulator
MNEESMQSLTKVLDILQLFLTTKREMTLGEISDSLKLNKTTVSRIINTLLKRGFMSQKHKRGKYFLGSIYQDFTDVIKSKPNLMSIASPYLIELSRLVNESVVLATLNGKDSLSTETFDNLQSHRDLRVVPSKITEPLHSASIGKIILAHFTSEDLQQYFNTHALEHHTPNTITNINAIKHELSNVKRKGVAFDDEEQSVGVRSIAAGLKDSEGKIIGSIGVAAPSARLSRSQLRKMAPLVLDYAARISKELGSN